MNLMDLGFWILNFIIGDLNEFNLLFGGKKIVKV